MKQMIDDRNKGYKDTTSPLLDEVIEHQKELETDGIIKHIENE